MPLTRCVLLLSVVLASCAVLPMSHGSESQRRGEKSDSELIGLLKKLREKLNNEKVADELEVELADHRKSSKELHMKSDGALSDDHKQQLLKAINSKRSAQGASDMYKLLWNDVLAEKAQQWAGACQYKRGAEPFSADEVGFLLLGQTLATFDAFDANQIVEKWLSDSASFNPDTQQCAINQPCGARTQLVFAGTTDVGCAVKQCDSVGGQSNANFLVCYYGPAASYDEEPFTSGSACTACRYGQFYCNNGLCDIACTSEGPECECKADCKNCGTKTSDCTCQCKAGSSGVNCANECKDFHTRCHSDTKNYWKKTQCTPDFPFVSRLCPKMCGLCQPGDNPCGRSHTNVEEIFLDISSINKISAGMSGLEHDKDDKRLSRKKEADKWIPGKGIPGKGIPGKGIPGVDD